MLSEVMEYYGFKKPFDHLGYFETEHHAHLVKELKIVIGQGRLVALTGIVGGGKLLYFMIFPRKRTLNHRLNQKPGSESCWN